MSWPIDPIFENPVLKWRESERVRQYRVTKEKFKNQKLSAEMIERLRQASKNSKVQEVAEKKPLELTLRVVKEDDLWKFVISKDCYPAWASSAAVFATEDAATASGIELIKAVKHSPVKLVTYL